MKWLMCLLIPFAAVAGDRCQLVSFQGRIEMRSGFEDQWISVTENQLLETRVTVRTGSKSGAVLQSFDGSVFRLPENAQIEMEDLKKKTRNEVIMALTALELQKLPGSRDQEKPAQAFVLHGALPVPESPEARDAYLFLEENGAVALYDQGFVSGFILKWNRLHYQFPDVVLSRADILIESAYEQMEMPGRLKISPKQ